MEAYMSVLVDQGWTVSLEDVQEVLEDFNVDQHEKLVSLSSKYLTYFLDVDLHFYGKPCLKNGVFDREKLVLQIDKVRNIARPKVSEDTGKENDRLLRITLTDGHSTVNALEMSRIMGMSTKTPPGTKIQIFPREILIERGFWLLNNNNCRLLGGQVKELVEKWRTNEDARWKPRTVGGICAPPWVPFGTKVDTSYLTRGFSAMSVTQVTDSSAPVSEEFEQTRKAIIAQAQTSAEPKTFGSAPVTVPQRSEVAPNVNERNYFKENVRDDTSVRNRLSGRTSNPRNFRGRGRGGRR